LKLRGTQADSGIYDEINEMEDAVHDEINDAYQSLNDNIPPYLELINDDDHIEMLELHPHDTAITGLQRLTHQRRHLATQQVNDTSDEMHRAGGYETVAAAYDEAIAGEIQEWTDDIPTYLTLINDGELENDTIMFHSDATQVAIAETGAVPMYLSLTSDGQ